ncbi:oxidoreductase [Haloarcula sp. CBA1130]|uniref:bi-domain-containing oxidoreductase n=1 Tax=unclassified Haloarcula TaxID=2624677 RepID=UPI001246779F|nr:MULTISPECIES: bi-domain-containing oxidoreductase [unclassified Haloarcula]KAA9398351.1 oxidoreductase [Haloarcula sp. CBA1129]KAA9402054.1 oxidoreductase [Haloarcula sp. CBA1130]
MKQVIQDYGSGELQVVEAPRPSASPTGIVVQTHHSVVSAGTERSMIEFANKNLLQKARERPDLVKQVVDKAKTDGILDAYQSATHRLNQPVPLGYSCSGEVVAVGDEVTEFSVGDRVACGGAGHASHAEVVAIPRNLAAHIPDGVSTRDASFMTLGAIALQGVRRADLTPGERVGVIGLGLVGKLVVQILDAYGFPTIGMDIAHRQVEAAAPLGLDAGLTIGADDVAESVNNFTDGHGLDAVVIAAGTDSNQPVELAGSLCRDQGTVSVIGNVSMDLPRDPFFEKELDFGVSRSYGPGRYDRMYEEQGLDYPFGHVRWTENRNMSEFLRLLAEESVDVAPLVTHEFPFEDALAAYDLIFDDESDEDVTGVVLQYDSKQEHSDRLQFRHSTPQPQDSVGVGLVGGGTFAEGTILPALEGLDVSLVGVATSSGTSSRHVAKKFGFEYATTDYTQVVSDDDVDLVVVATRNNLHADIAVEALDQNKDVHVEKPLALNRTELRAVADAARDSAGRLMVGFNRRFSPMSTRIREELSNRSTPLMVNYRVSVDRLPSDHWVQDPEEGGGRIVAELCHFVDYLQFITESVPERLTATPITSGGAHSGEDNIDVTVSFADGSVGNILYTTLGDPSSPKEYVEIFGEQETHTITNYKTGKIIPLSQEKGHEQQFEAFISSIREGEPSPIPTTELVRSTLMTFAIQRSVRENRTVTLSEMELFETG